MVWVMFFLLIIVVDCVMFVICRIVVLKFSVSCDSVKLFFMICVNWFSILLWMIGFCVIFLS